LGGYSFGPKKNSSQNWSQKHVLPVTTSTYGKKQQNNVSSTTLLKAMKFIFISGIVE